MKLALQLYSMRDCADQLELLTQLPALGIDKVEGYGGVYGAPETYRSTMDAHGISMPVGHIGLNDIEADFDATLRLANTLGMTHVYAPYLEDKDRPNTVEDWQKLGQRLDVIGKKYSQCGIAFGWHNHDFEFAPLTDGSMPIDILLNAAPDISWEADLAWVVCGGCDPLKYIEKYGSRISTVHVKDIAQDGTNLDQDGWSDLGAGTMDWLALLQACRIRSSDLIYALEHDKPSDPLEYVNRSAAEFKTLWGQTHD